MKISDLWNGSVYFFSLVAVGAGGIYVGGLLQTKYKTHDILEQVLDDEEPEKADYVANKDKKPHEISALLNTIVKILKPGIVEGLHTSFKEPQDIGGGYTLHVNRCELDEHQIIFQDIKVIHKRYLEPTELLLAGKLFLAGDPEIEVTLKSSSKLKPNIEGDINKLDLSTNVFCKLDFTTYILTIWFEGGVKPDIDLEIDVSIFPLALDYITESIVRTLFYYTEEKPLIIELMGGADDSSSGQSTMQDSGDVSNMSEDISSPISPMVYIPDAGTLRVSNIYAKDIAGKDRGNTISDPYLVLHVGDEQFKTKHISKTLSPEWKETFQLTIHNTCDSIQFEVKDHDYLNKDDICGHVIKQIGKFTKSKEKQSHKLLLVPKGELYFDTEWISESKRMEI